MNRIGTLMLPLAILCGCTPAAPAEPNPLPVIEDVHPVPGHGTGDDVSPYFEPPPPTTWTIAHSGETGSVVYAHCLGGGSVLVADQTGAVQDARQIEFARGPCFWEVRADGEWSLAPTS